MIPQVGKIHARGTRRLLARGMAKLATWTPGSSWRTTKLPRCTSSKHAIKAGIKSFKFNIGTSWKIMWRFLRVDYGREESGRRDSKMTQTATTDVQSAVPTIVSSKTMPAVPEMIVGKSLCDMSETAMAESHTVAIAPVIAGSTPPILSFMRDRLRYETRS